MAICSGPQLIGNLSKSQGRQVDSLSIWQKSFPHKRGGEPMKKLYCKFNIEKTDGTPTDPLARYFVLRIDTDHAARAALLTYANEMVKQGEIEFANQLTEWVAGYEKQAEEMF